MLSFNYFILYRPPCNRSKMFLIYFQNKFPSIIHLFKNQWYNQNHQKKSSEVKYFILEIDPFSFTNPVWSRSLCVGIRVTCPHGILVARVRVTVCLSVLPVALAADQWNGRHIKSPRGISHRHVIRLLL